jgi:hypothetical protein
VRFRRALGLIVALSFADSCGGSGSPSSPTSPSTPPVPPPPSGPACGVKRWFVKTLADTDASRVNINAITPISIRDLKGFSTHCNGLPESRTFAEEFRVFEVVGRITFVAHEDDRDYHIALEDPASPGSTVVTELADTLCQGAISSPHFTAMMGAGIMFQSLLNGRSPSALVGSTVRVRGVGFYDFAHGQRGRSANCIELHPMVAIESAR